MWLKTLVLVVLAAIGLAGCGPAASRPASPAAGGSVPLPSLGAAIPIAADAHTGTSSAMALDGSYQIQWLATPDKPGCTFHLFIATDADGPSVVDLGQGVLPGKARANGSASFSVPSGRYFVRADRSAKADCRSGWSATLNPEVAAPS